jgi:hypothetical protein
VHITGIKKIVVRISLVLLLLMVIGSILLSIPSVQTNLGRKTTHYLQKEFDVDINVQLVDLSFLGSIQLKNILIRNHHSDTLIYVNNLSSSIFSYRNIVNNKMEFGEISLEDFELYLTTYKGEDDDALNVFVDKFDDGTGSDEPSGFLLTSSELDFENGYVEIEDQNEPDEKTIFFKNISGEVENFKLEGPNVYANIHEISFIDDRNIEVEKLTTDFTYTKSYMKFLHTSLQTKTSLIRAEVNFNYNREDFSDFNNKVNIDASVSNADISLEDLQKFYREFGDLDILHFSTKITGTFNDLNFQNVALRSDRKALIYGNFNFKNIFEKDSVFSFNSDLLNFTSDYQHLKTTLPGILGKNLPPSFKNMGRFSISGKSFYTKNLLDAQLRINTDLGSAITDLELSNFNQIEEASYRGYVELIDLELGELLKDSLVGQLSMEADVDGQGFSLEHINTSIKGRISKHKYNDYTYRNIGVNGIVESQQFRGEMEVNDDNIKLNFNGLADFSSEVYDFNFKTIVDYCDLKKINLFTRDSISNIKGEIDIKVKGTNFDNLIGAINFENTSYTNQKNSYFFKDFNITSSFENDDRTITVNSSEIIEGRIKGKFKFNELGKLVQNSIGSLYTNYVPFLVAPDQDLDFSFKIYNKIVEVFYPGVLLSANSSIKGNIISNDNYFKLAVKSPKVETFSTVISDLNIQIDNKYPLFNTQLSIDNIENKYYNVSDVYLVNKTINDTLFFRTIFKGGEKKREDFNLSFYHTINADKKSIFGIQRSDFTFKDTKWLANGTGNNRNKVIYDNKTRKFDLEKFDIRSGNQEITFFGKIDNKALSKDLAFEFANVQLDNITPDIDSLNLKGVVNGSINYHELKEQISPTANIEIKDFNINNSHQGDLKIAIKGKNSVEKYAVESSLIRDGDISFSAIGDLDFTPNKPTLDVIIDFEKFKLDAFSPLGEDVLTNIRGYAYGNVNIMGQLSEPTMEGQLFLDQAGIYFPYLNIGYDFDGTSLIELRGHSFNFIDVLMTDDAHNTKGILTGSIEQTGFSYWKLDLAINSSNLLMLNTIETENSAYFGKGFLEGDATLKGPTDNLVINVNGRTKKGTHLVIPISDVKTIEDSQLIRFINKDKPGNEEVRKAFISENLKGLSLNFNIEVTKDAVVEMILDKATGSYLSGSGTGNLQLELDTKDKFDMYGDFNVDNGVYNFKYGFITKPFKVVKGGSVSWNGDPYTAIIDIETVHRVSANPKALLENITANRKIPIDLITRFSGELFNSQREFDIAIPNSSSTITSELEFKLNNNINSKTIHFMSLLASGSFYNESDLSINTSGLVYGTASDLLSNAFENIFNADENRFKFKPVYTVGEKNKVDNFDIYDQLAIDLDYQLNDKVIINGKVGMPIGSKEQSSVIGEVKVEFLLNDEGTLRSSIFNRQNEIQYTEEEEGYTQGIGLTYQIDFNNGMELLKKLGLKRDKIKDSISSKKIRDSLITSNNLINFKNR